MSKRNESLMPETGSKEVSDAKVVSAEIAKGFETAHKGIAQECTQYIYVGPSVPNGRLKNGVAYNGTLNAVKSYLAEDLSTYPTAEKLIIPIFALAEVQAKVKQVGNSYNKHYNDTAALITAEKKED